MRFLYNELEISIYVAVVGCVRADTAAYARTHYDPRTILKLLELRVRQVLLVLEQRLQLAMP